MHRQHINLPVCVFVCPSHFLLTRLQVIPLNGFLQFYRPSLKDADLRKGSLWSLDDE